MTTEKKIASNVIFLVRETDDGEEIVQTFRATEESRSPKRALSRFLKLVLGDPSHELHSAAREGELSYMSGHPQQVRLATQTVVDLG